MSGFGDLEGGFEGYFEEVDSSEFQNPALDSDITDAFEDIGDIPLPDVEVVELPSITDVPIPKKAPLTPAEKELLRKKNRKDKPVTPSSEVFAKLRKKPDDSDESQGSPAPTPNKETEVKKDKVEPKPEVKPDSELLPKRRVFNGYKNPNTPLNKIKAPDFEVSKGDYVISDDDVDTDLMAMATDLETFSVEAVSENQVVSPTSAEFIAQYYRVINLMAYKIALNKTVTSAIHVDGMWSNGTSLATINMSSTQNYLFDAIYIHCVQDEVIKRFRAMYEDKRVHFSKMTVQQTLGAGHGISSAKQASMYLEKMATVSISSALDMLGYKGIMFETREWFEDNIPDKGARAELLGVIQRIINRSSVAQAKKYAKDDDVITKRGRRYFLFAKKYLSRGVSVHVSNQQLQLSALIFFLSGIDKYEPTPKNIGLVELTDKLIENEGLGESFDTLTYESHRHCYPINELSFFS